MLCGQTCGVALQAIPAIPRRLRELGGAGDEPSHVALSWVMCLFTVPFGPSTTPPLWDWYFVEGGKVCVCGMCVWHVCVWLWLWLWLWLYVAVAVAVGSQAETAALVAALDQASHLPPLQASSKFAALIFALASKHARAVSRHASQLSQVLARCSSFMVKAATTAVAKAAKLAPASAASAGWG